MSSVNKVILIGNLGKDPDVKEFQSGSKVANLNVATSTSWKDKSTGERKEKTEWHRVVVFDDRSAGFAEKHLSKGARVYIEGAIERREYQDKDGNKRDSFEIVIRPYRGELVKLDRTAGDEASGPRVTSGVKIDIDDDIPF